MACGIGYGSQILKDAGHNVTGYDKDPEALEYGREHYPRANYRLADGVVPLKTFDAGVCFETIEHIEDPRPLLLSFRGAPLLLASVPNESVMPYGRGYAFHFRHYTRAEFRALLRETGWEVVEWYGQEGPESDVEPDCEGRTIIAVAKRVDVPKHEPVKRPDPPGHVCIVGLGPSERLYGDLVKRLGSRKAFCDQTWVINSLGDVYHADLIFHMDDVRIQETRAEARPQSNIANMLSWLPDPPCPVVTSRVKEGYRNHIAFPLEEVVNDLGLAYFNSTAAYAVAYAIWARATKITCIGMDFTYPNASDAERGRGCVELWLGVAHARGIRIGTVRESSLLDACQPFSERLYGYDTVKVDLLNKAGGGFKVEMTPLEKWPTAEEIEAAYDHSRHPNPLVSER